MSLNKIINSVWKYPSLITSTLMNMPHFLGILSRLLLAFMCVIVLRSWSFVTMGHARNISVLIAWSLIISGSVTTTRTEASTINDTRAHARATVFAFTGTLLWTPDKNIRGFKSTGEDLYLTWKHLICSGPGSGIVPVTNWHALLRIPNNW